MNSETLFSMALGLQTPWQVKDVTFLQTSQPVVNSIYISILRLARAS